MMKPKVAISATAAAMTAALASTALSQELPAPPLVKEINNGNWLPLAEAESLRDELYYQRAVFAYMTMLPALNTIGMKDGSEKAFGAGYNVLPIWKQRMDAKTLVTTPNSDVIYAMGYVDLGKDGPIVFDAPPLMQGILLDFWQRPIPFYG